MFPAGDRVVVTGLAGGVVHATGKTFEDEWVDIWTVKGGKVVAFEEYHDSSAIIAAFIADPE